MISLKHNIQEFTSLMQCLLLSTQHHRKLKTLENNIRLLWKTMVKLSFYDNHLNIKRFTLDLHPPLTEHCIYFRALLFISVSYHILTYYDSDLYTVQYNFQLGWVQQPAPMVAFSTSSIFPTTQLLQNTIILQGHHHHHKTFQANR